MVICAVYGCNNKDSKEPKISFHRFPLDRHMKNKWWNLCRRKDRGLKPYDRVCGEHFISTDYRRDFVHELLGLPVRHLLNESVIPSLNLPTRNAPVTSNENSSNRVGNAWTIHKELRLGLATGSLSNKMNSLIEQEGPNRDEANGKIQESENSQINENTMEELKTEREIKTEEEEFVANPFHFDFDSLDRTKPELPGDEKSAIKEETNVFVSDGIELSLPRLEGSRSFIGGNEDTLHGPSTSKFKMIENPTSMFSQDKHRLHNRVKSCLKKEVLEPLADANLGGDAEGSCYPNTFESDFGLTSSAYTFFSSPSAPFACELCGKEFSKKKYLSRHRLIHSNEKPFVCGQCDKKFTHKVSLKNHIFTHTGEKPFACEVCNRKFREKGILIRHGLIHSGKKSYACEQCVMNFTHRSSLKTHLLIHTGEKPFACQQCDKKFTHRVGLKAHLFNHTGEKKFACGLCDKRFGEKRNLKYHRLMHSGEKPFACEQCGKKFTQKQNLKKHFLIHTGEKTFACELCKEKFSQKITLRDHLLTHTGEKPFECEHCDKKFIQKGNYMVHLLTHIDEKPFECKNCNKRFCKKGSLKNHMKIHTGEKSS